MWKNLLSRLGLGQQTATPISKLTPGASFCIEGVAIAMPRPHLAPLTGAACATLSIQQEQRMERAQGGSGRFWNAVNDIDFGQTFYVRDETGLVRVDRQGWSLLRATRRGAKGISDEDLEENLRRFRRANAGDPLLAALESIGLDWRTPEVRCWENVVPERARVRVSGEVRSTGEPFPTGDGFPIPPATFREAPQLLELVPPGPRRLEIRVLKPQT